MCRACQAGKIPILISDDSWTLTLTNKDSSCNVNCVEFGINDGFIGNY